MKRKLKESQWETRIGFDLGVHDDEIVCRTVCDLDLNSTRGFLVNISCEKYRSDEINRLGT